MADGRQSARANTRILSVVAFMFFSSLVHELCNQQRGGPGLSPLQLTATGGGLRPPTLRAAQAVVKMRVTAVFVQSYASPHGGFWALRTARSRVMGTFSVALLELKVRFSDHRQLPTTVHCTLPPCVVTS